MRCKFGPMTKENDSPIAKIDYWNLSWTWQDNEFITKMMGAITKAADLDICLNGIAGKSYTNPDLNKVFSCSVSPEIIDLPLQSYDDTQIGGVQYCYITTDNHCTVQYRLVGWPHEVYSLSSLLARYTVELGWLVTTCHVLGDWL